MSFMTQAAPPPPGWYPDQHNPALQRWWQGSAWTDATRPAGQFDVQPRPAASFAHWGLIGLLAALVGLAIVLFTNVTLLSGMNQVVFGAILTVAGAVVALVFARRSIVLRLVCVALAIVAIAGAAYDQHQLDQRRSDLQQVFDSP
jgi:disulfide bond formation protein DsbB